LDVRMSNKSRPYNERLLDPTVVGSKALNATQKGGAVGVFQKIWADVAEERKRGKIVPLEWEAWWSVLKPSQVRLAPISFLSCSAPDSCIGTDAVTDECICGADAQQPSEDIVV